MTMYFFNLFANLFSDKMGELIKRAFFRSAALALLLITASTILEFLIQMARYHGWDIPDRFPELLIIFRAVAILTWFEMSVFWIRLATSPKIDNQCLADEASRDPMAAAVVYWAKLFAWAFRVAVLMQLCDFWK
jgi:hypothetical protein